MSIEIYLRSLERFGARAVVLTSDSHVLLRFDGGDRYATQSTPHEALVSMVGAVANTSATAALDAGQPAEFEHFFDGSIYQISVTPEGDRWTVSIAPAGAELPAAPAPAPPPAAERRTKRVSASNRWIDQLLVKMVDDGASDLHLSSGNPPYFRVHGDIRRDSTEPLAPDFLLGKLLEITPEKNREEFEERKDTDFGYGLEGIARFRVNLFEDRAGPGAVLRQIPHEIPGAQDLGIPEKVLELCDLNKGLVLVTGPTGSGKSTTLAALIDHINASRAAHIITIEDPIEFVHQNKKCLVNQREVHTHTRSFKDALRAALREDPDIVLVGEMRDLETIAIAVETAETGHLVFGTLHTATAPSTVDRIIDQFPADRQEQIRQMLSKSLRGVIAQTLCRRKTGGRVAAYEILIATPAVENLIRERKTFQLYSVMQTSRNLGMLTLGDSLVELARQGLIDGREAYLKAINKEEIRNLLARANIQI